MTGDMLLRIVQLLCEESQDGVRFFYIADRTHPNKWSVFLGLAYHRIVIGKRARPDKWLCFRSIAKRWCHPGNVSYLA